MPQYLYRLMPTRPEMLSEGPTEREAAVVAEHFEHLSRLTDEGVVFMAGRTMVTDARAFGIVVFQAASDQEAQALMARDPAVRHGVMQGAVFPFRVALWGQNPMDEEGD